MIGELPVVVLGTELEKFGLGMTLTNTMNKSKIKSKDDEIR